VLLQGVNTRKPAALPRIDHPDRVGLHDGKERQEGSRQSVWLARPTNSRGAGDGQNHNGAGYQPCTAVNSQVLSGQGFLPAVRRSVVNTCGHVWIRVRQIRCLRGTYSFFLFFFCFARVFAAVSRAQKAGGPPDEGIRPKKAGPVIEHTDGSLQRSAGPEKL